MPTYEYRCLACGAISEVVHSMTTEPHVECSTENCPGPTERLISLGIGFILKGYGWAKDGYGNKR
jgi:putative FmdB family regulatory protein